MIQGIRGGLLGSLKSLLSPPVNANSVSIGPNAMADLELLPPQESCMAATWLLWSIQQGPFSFEDFQGL